LEALLCLSKNQIEDALKVLMKFGKQNENSEDDGIDETVEILCKVDDLEIISKYGRWVLIIF
jgi:hypothetical protein